MQVYALITIISVRKIPEGRSVYILKGGVGFLWKEREPALWWWVFTSGTWVFTRFRMWVFEFSGTWVSTCQMDVSPCIQIMCAHDLWYDCPGHVWDTFWTSWSLGLLMAFHWLFPARLGWVMQWIIRHSPWARLMVFFGIVTIGLAKQIPDTTRLRPTTRLS